MIGKVKVTTPNPPCPKCGGMAGHYSKTCFTNAPPELDLIDRPTPRRVPPRGTDITQEALDIAEEFIARAAKEELPESFVIRRADLIRLVAWYGAIRADGAPPKPTIVVEHNATEAS